MNKHNFKSTSALQDRPQAADNKQLLTSLVIESGVMCVGCEIIDNVTGKACRRSAVCVRDIIMRPTHHTLPLSGCRSLCLSPSQYPAGMCQLLPISSDYVTTVTRNSMNKNNAGVGGRGQQSPTHQGSPALRVIDQKYRSQIDHDKQKHRSTARAVTRSITRSFPRRSYMTDAE